jgi:hypothetical protein
MLARLTRAISKGPLAEALDRSAPDVAVQEAFAETDAAVAERPGMNRA